MHIREEIIEMNSTNAFTLKLTYFNFENKYDVH